MRRWLLVLPLLLAAAPSLAVSPTISGVITNAQTGFGMAGVDLDAFDSAGLSVSISGGVSGTGGFYTLTLPGPGTFTLRADATASSGFVDQYYNHVFLPSLAAQIVAADGDVLTGFDFSLPIGFSISGQVTGPNGPLDAIDMDLYAANGEFLSGYPATTAGGGFYAFGALPPGTYYLRANPSLALGQYYTTVYYGNAPFRLTSTPVTITSGNLSGVNIAVQAGGTIGGFVRDAVSNAALAGIDLDILDATSGLFLPANGTSDASGAYQTGVVPAGNYLLRVDPTLVQGYPRTYYPNSFDRTGAVAVVVSAGGVTPGIDFSLARAGSATGRVTDALGGPLGGVDLDCYDALGRRLDVTAATISDGTFVYGPLPPGRLFIRAQPAAMSGHVIQYYSGAATLAEAQSILISGNSVAPNINFSLGPAGWVAGLVVNGASQPLSGIDLDLFDAASGLRQEVRAKTLADGTYVLGPVAPRAYKIRCDPSPSQGYARKYYLNHLTLGSADPFEISAAAGIAADFTLDAAGSMSGVVTALVGGLAVAGASIEIYQPGSLLKLDPLAISDGTGAFTVFGVPPGSWFVRGVPPAGASLLPIYYNAAWTPATAQAIPLAPGGQASGIGLALPPLPSPNEILQYLLGASADPAGLDLNGDGAVDAADLVARGLMGLG